MATDARPDPALPVLGLQEQLAVLEEDKTELDKVLELLLRPENIQHNTELSRNEILAFSVLTAMSKQYRLEVLRNWLAENLVLRVSKGRQGRKEWVKIVSRFGSYPGGEFEQGRGGISRMFGFGSKRRRE